MLFFLKPRWLNNACEKVMTATPSNFTSDARSPRSNCIAPTTKSHMPALMAASTVTRPARLNHAVTQPQPRPPRIEAQCYSPPAVGKAEATCAIAAATMSENKHATGQPMPMLAPPTLQKPT